MHVQAANKLAQNNQKSLNRAFEHTFRMDYTKNTDPHRKAFVGDIRRSGKADVDQRHGQNSFELEQDTIYDNLVKKQTQFRSRDIAIYTLR
ncbi:hypothetical protein DPMN_052106 [Dreissena polymorpha]|uniref:Uncharacterized protein n=1 Tax=Dreissena polymorpha TaxID=45954 RepID=A0A9D4CKU0_DREPO|nr:hypothetical protein DPMN_052106 [Dreissena polymorpha]